MRAKAAKALVTYTDDETASSLGRLLLDDEDVAVTQRTAKALMERNDYYGASLLFGALALADAQQGDTILSALDQAQGSGTFDIRRLAKSVLAGDNWWARFGATKAMNWMGLDLD